MKNNRKKLLMGLMSVSFLLFISGNLHAGSAGTGITPQEALDSLKKGNQRYLADKRLYQNQGAKTRLSTSDKGQYPFASVLGCSDSRAPVEHIFDAGVGEIFTIRVAGNVSGTDEIGTIEYGVGHLKTPVLVVLGHTKCGAVTAVVKGEEVHGSIPALVDKIIPAADKARKKIGSGSGEKLIETAIRENVWQSIADLLKRSDEIRNLISEKKLIVVGALYHLDSGDIEWLGEHPDQAGLLMHKTPGSNFIITSSFIIFNGIILVVYGVFFILFIGKNRLVKAVQVRGRIVASFAALIISLGYSAAWTMLRNTGTESKAGKAEMYTGAGISLFVAMLFALVYMNSIVSSFKRAIGIIKSAAVPAAEDTE